MAPLEIDKTCTLRAKGFNTKLSASLCSKVKGRLQCFKIIITQNTDLILYSSIGLSSDPYKEGSKLMTQLNIFLSLNQDLNWFRIFK